MSHPSREARWRWVQIQFAEPPENEFDPNEEPVVKLRKSCLDMSRVVLYYPADAENRVCLDLDTGEIIIIRGDMLYAQKIIEPTGEVAL